VKGYLFYLFIVYPVEFYGILFDVLPLKFQRNQSLLFLQ